MSDKDFKVKNKITIAGLTNATGVLLSNNHLVDSHTNLATQYGGTTYAATSLSSTVPLWSAVSVSSNITLSKWINYMVNTSAARTLTLPASPSSGDEIHIFDVTGTAATNKITVGSNSNKINGSVQDLEIDANNAAVVLIYTGSDYGWKVS